MPKPKPEVVDLPGIVYPVSGAFLQGVPAAPTSTDDATARRLVATGAFTFDVPPGAAATDVIPLSEAARAALAFYAPEA